MSTITVPADLCSPSPDTMEDPNAGGRGVLSGVALAVVFWAGVAWLAWAVLS